MASLTLGLNELLAFLRDKHGEKAVKRIREYPSGDFEAFGIPPHSKGMESWWDAGNRHDIEKELLETEYANNLPNIPPTGINWRKREDTEGFPTIRHSRILIFSPEYPDNDTMQVRIIDAQFFKTCIDATHWAPINTPGKAIEG